MKQAQLTAAETLIRNDREWAATVRVSTDNAFSHDLAAEETERVNVLLGKGQSMLNLDDAQAAVECFEQALRINPNNAEAWVRKEPPSSGSSS